MSNVTAADPDLITRFKREAEAAGGLNHRNIVTIYELGEHEGQPYIAMEFLEGQDLTAVIVGKGVPLSMEQRIEASQKQYQDALTALVAACRKKAGT